MTNPRRPFRINVGFIIHEEVGYTCEFPFEFEKVSIDEDLDLQNFIGTIQVSRTPQGLLFEGKFSGETRLECVRCLNEFSKPLAWNLTELYAFNERSVSDSGLIIPDDAQIDVESLIREYALLEIPINPICKPDCKGLCPVCGQDLNVADCGHHPPQDESPFSVLKKFL
jgi:uncharacterized protein